MSSCSRQARVAWARERRSGASASPPTVILGIGTRTPTAKLQVAGTGYSTVVFGRPASLPMET
jgi:hypothetical protein